MPGEFDIINRYFRRAQDAAADGVTLGIGDDAALLSPAFGMQLALSTDTLVEGVHFPADTPPADVGWKSLAVNLSDLAAMGATPRGCLLALSLPEVEENWIADFAKGFFACADQYACPLVGGDTTATSKNGPRVITVTVVGEVPANEALRRDGANSGDFVCVSGTPGDAAAGLQAWLAGERNASTSATISRLLRPEPRLALGMELRGVATSALDLSDGFSGDIAHILKASSQRTGSSQAGTSLGAEIRLAALPFSSALSSLPVEVARNLALSGGDDYELCFTVPPASLMALRVAAANAQVPVAIIGRITDDGCVRYLDENDQPWQPSGQAWQHFSR